MSVIDNKDNKNDKKGVSSEKSKAFNSLTSSLVPVKQIADVKSSTITFINQEKGIVLSMPSLYPKLSEVRTIPENLFDPIILDDSDDVKEVTDEKKKNTEVKKKKINNSEGSGTKILSDNHYPEKEKVKKIEPEKRVEKRRNTRKKISSDKSPSHHLSELSSDFSSFESFSESELKDEDEFRKEKHKKYEVDRKKSPINEKSPTRHKSHSNFKDLNKHRHHRSHIHTHNNNNLKKDEDYYSRMNYEQYPSDVNLDEKGEKLFLTELKWSSDGEIKSKHTVEDIADDDYFTMLSKKLNE